MENGFVELLELLGNEAEPLPATKFPELSDLGAAQLARFRGAWDKLSPDRRLTLLSTLGELANSKIELSFEAINRLALEDPDPRARAQSIRNLWESEDPQLGRQLVRALQSDPAIEVRIAAGLALGAFVLLAETQDLDDRLRLEIEQVLLTAARSDTSREVRDAALQSLGYSTRDEVPGLIEQVFSSGVPSSQLAAMRAMARSADPRWGSVVQARLHDPLPEMRLEAVQAAGEIGMREAAEDLQDLLEDVDDRIRTAAIWSLGQVGGPVAAEALQQLLDSDPEHEDQFIQDALDNLAFEDGVRDILLLDFDDEDPGA